jgi:citrate synthase
MGFPVSIFTSLFAMGRIPGWLAHWEENLLDEEQAIARPQQLFVGPDVRDYVPMDAR